MEPYRSITHFIHITKITTVYFCYFVILIESEWCVAAICFTTHQYRLTWPRQLIQSNKALTITICYLIDIVSDRVTNLSNSRTPVVQQSYISRTSVVHQSYISRTSVVHQSYISRTSVVQRSYIGRAMECIY